MKTLDNRTGLSSRVCIMCQLEKEDGLRIFDELICLECEWMILITDANSSEYWNFTKKLKKQLFSIT